MEKKGNQLGLYSVFFIASVLTELYCLLQFRDDYIVVIGIGAVVLIATYLLMDSFCSEYGLNGKGRTKDKEEQEDAIEELRNKKGLKQLLERVEEIGKIQKALYVSNKKIEESLTREIQQLSNNMVKVGKLVTKYNQQDTKALFQLEKDTKEDINNQLEQLIDLLNTINHLFSSGAISSFSTPTADEEIIIKQNNELEIELNNLDQELEKVQEIDNMVNKMTEEPKEELKAEPEMEENQDPNHQMTPEEIAAMVNKMTEEPKEELKAEPEMEENQDPNHQMTPEEIAAMVNKMTEEPKEELKAEPEMEENQDSNHQMTPEEIAAMVNKMTEEPKEELKAEPEMEENQEPNHQMTPEEIAAMVNKMTEESKEELKTEPEMELKEEELLPEDIEGLFAAAGIESDSEEKETKEEPSVSFNLGDDPNKPMTPEEIAAFISSMNQ